MTPDQFEAAVLAKRATLGSTPGLRPVGPSAAPRHGLNRNTTPARLGPLSPKTPGGTPATGQATAESSFANLDGLSASTGGATAGGRIGGALPPWLAAVHSGTLPPTPPAPKTAAGPLDTDGKGPIVTPDTKDPPKADTPTAPTSRPNPLFQAPSINPLPLGGAPARPPATPPSPGRSSVDALFGSVLGGVGTSPEVAVTPATPGTPTPSLMGELFPPAAGRPGPPPAAMPAMPQYRPPDPNQPLPDPPAEPKKYKSDTPDWLIDARRGVESVVRGIPGAVVGDGTAFRPFGQDTPSDAVAARQTAEREHADRARATEEYLRQSYQSTRDPLPKEDARPSFPEGSGARDVSFDIGSSYVGGKAIGEGLGALGRFGRGLFSRGAVAPKATTLPGLNVKPPVAEPAVPAPAVTPRPPVPAPKPSTPVPGASTTAPPGSPFQPGGAGNTRPRLFSDTPSGLPGGSGYSLGESSFPALGTNTRVLRTKPVPVPTDPVPTPVSPNYPAAQAAQRAHLQGQPAPAAPVTPKLPAPPEPAVPTQNMKGYVPEAVRKYDPSAYPKNTPFQPADERPTAETARQMFDALVTRMRASGATRPPGVSRANNLLKSNPELSTLFRPGVPDPAARLTRGDVQRLMSPPASAAPTVKPPVTPPGEPLPSTPPAAPSTPKPSTSPSATLPTPPEPTPLTLADDIPTVPVAKPIPLTPAGLPTKPVNPLLEGVPASASGWTKTRNALGYLADPFSWPGRGLAWLGQRQSLPSWARATATGLGRTSDAVATVPGALTGTRDLRTLFQAGASTPGGGLRAYGAGLAGGAASGMGIRTVADSLSEGGPGTNTGSPWLNRNPAIIESLIKNPTPEGAGTAYNAAMKPTMQAGQTVGELAGIGVEELDQAAGRGLATYRPVEALGQALVRMKDRVLGKAQLFNDAKSQQADQLAATGELPPFQQTKDELAQKNPQAYGPGSRVGPPAPKLTEMMSGKVNEITGGAIGKPTPTQEELEARNLSRPGPSQGSTPQVPAAPPVDPKVRENEFVGGYNSALAKGDYRAANDLARKYVEQTPDKTQLLISPLARLTGDSFGVPQPELDKLIDGPAQEDQQPLSSRLAAAGTELDRLNSLPPEQRTQNYPAELNRARTAYAELNRDYQGRASDLYEQRVLAPMRERADATAGTLYRLKAKVEGGEALTPAEAQELVQAAADGRRTLGEFSTHALRKAQLNLAVKDTPSDANPNLARLGDVMQAVNDPATPIGKQTQEQIARDLAQAGVDDPQGKASDLFGQMDWLPKLLMYGGLGLGAVGLLGSAFGLFSGAPIVAALGGAAALMGAANGDPSQLLKGDFWSGLPGLFGSALGFGGQAKPTHQPAQQPAPPPGTLTTGPSGPGAVPSSSALKEFFAQQKVPLDPSGLPQFDKIDAARATELIKTMSPRLRAEAQQQLLEKVQADSGGRINTPAGMRNPGWLRKVMSDDQQKQLQRAADLYDRLEKGAAVEFKPDYTPQQLGELGVSGRLAGTGPRLAGGGADSPTGRFADWYGKYHAGSRGPDDAAQIARWKSMRAAHGARLVAAPSARRAFSLMNWGVDPERLLPGEARPALRQMMLDHRKRQTAGWLTGNA